ncbi:MAG TPA: hypothetical protein VHO49_09560 [Anaerolineales bacterium]|nr:hypothetical protein [Anaerolineales bacterium]
MSPKRFPSNVQNQAEDIRAAWNYINTSMTFGDLDFLAFNAAIEKADALEGEVNDLRTLLIDRLNQRNDAYAGLWDNVKRVRSAVKGIYGDDSSQYEMVGGTRASERKPRSRRVSE